MSLQEITVDLRVHLGDMLESNSLDVFYGIKPKGSFKSGKDIEFFKYKEPIVIKENCTLIYKVMYHEKELFSKELFINNFGYSLPTSLNTVESPKEIYTEPQEMVSNSKEESGTHEYTFHPEFLENNSENKKEASIEKPELEATHAEKHKSPFVSFIELAFSGFGLFSKK